MGKHVVDNVPRYFEPYVNDCFTNTYGSVLSYMGYNPRIILADYLSFMYDNATGLIGANFLYRDLTSVEFKAEELNTSFVFLQLPGTRYYTDEVAECQEGAEGSIQINMYIHDDSKVAEARLRTLIHADKPVITVVDLHDMSYHRAYQKDHGLHAVVITGYDDETQSYTLFDRYELSSGTDFLGTLPMDVIHATRVSNNPLSNPLLGQYERPIRNLWIEIQVGSAFNVSEDRIVSILNESCRRMLGQQEILGQMCGLGRMEAFRSDLLLRKEQPLDEKAIYLFRSYYNTSFKTLARSRKRFRAFIEEIGHVLSQDASARVLELLEESAKRWDICANLSLKLGISKSLKIIDDLDKHLQVIMELENEVVECMRTSDSLASL
ncbi:BtrH N-terminal domain-containing protein [Paenibacillus sp. SI8]|uniref:BtrH N-terminal domain-containing protein n=1 Tax=unclassified Paenibacillus TaxID=185978 RepID=UPI0034665A53